MYFSSFFTNYFIKSTSETNLDRDPGQVINPPPVAFEIGLDPNSLDIQDVVPAGFDIGLPPAAGVNPANRNPNFFDIGLPPAEGVSPVNRATNFFDIGLPPASGVNPVNRSPSFFEIGLPPHPRGLAQPVLPTFTASELKIYNGASVLFTLGILLSKQQTITRNLEEFTTYEVLTGVQEVQGDGRPLPGKWTYTALYQGIFDDVALASLESALTSMTHIGLSGGRRLPCRPSATPPHTQQARAAAITTITVIPTSIYNTGGGVGV